MSELLEKIAYEGTAVFPEQGRREGLYLVAWWMEWGTTISVATLPDWS